MQTVILCGGTGGRLWPLSRSCSPKQFSSIHGEGSLLQQTIQRLDEIESLLLITNEEHRFLAAEHLRQINQQATILLEPAGRNTAPAIALSALLVEEKNSILLILPSDHVIENKPAFQAAIEQAKPVAEAGKMVTFGIVPTHAETGYGYIQTTASSSDLVSPVAAFVEKPDLSTANDYLAENARAFSEEGDESRWLWNSGMFMFRADRYLEVLGRYRPDILSACQKAMAQTQADIDFLRIDAAAFEACPDESIDYAVMEPLSRQRGNNVMVVPLDVGWSDVGSWSALWELKEKDDNGNVLKGDVIAHHTNNSLVMGSDRLVATLGVDDLIIVDTKDALMVAHKDKVQDVKKLVAKVKQQGRNEHFQHREVYRPWGKYDSIDSGSRYQVKRITVNPGAKLSLQKHHHRAEHWIVVKGTASVTCGENTFLVSENESTYIPLAEVHSLSNPGKVPLELIEVQSGSYLGEDDIVRLKDDYGRS